MVAYNQKRSDKAEKIINKVKNHEWYAHFVHSAHPNANDPVKCFLPFSDLCCLIHSVFPLDCLQGSGCVG